MSFKILHTENELLTYLNKQIEEVDGNVVIQAGHFALIQDKVNNYLIPAIVDSISDQETKQYVASHPYMGEFPIKTWELALKLITQNKLKKIKVSIIVNDWQWVPKSVSGEKNFLRKDFYEKQKTIPDDYVKLLKKYNLQEDIILPIITDKEKIVFFGEQKMRNKARGEFKDIKEDSAVGCGIGYLPFLNYLEKKVKTNLLISFIPKTCYGPINYCTDYFIENHSKELKYVNVFCYGSYDKDFFEQVEIVDYL